MKKMALSVLMSIKDKTSEPLRKMKEESNHYSKAISKIQKLQKDDSATVGMIDSFNATKEAMKKNSLAIDTATEKLKKLEEQAAKATKPNAALTEKIAKQREKLESLTDTQKQSEVRYIKLGKQLQKTGVKMYDLNSESARLNKRYKDHGKEITKLQKKYYRLQTAMKPIQSLNGKLKMPTIEGAKNGMMASSGVMASMAGFGLIINDTATKIDDMASVADDVKMPVSELQAMRMQARLAGAESEDMDAAIKEMMLRWGEMKTFQKGAMNDYFEDTGNHKAYKDLMEAQNATEAYLVLLREIAKETDESKQNFMADEFFGGDSEKMLKVLRSGADGFEKAKQVLNDSGGPVSQESVRNAGLFTASMKKMGAIVDSLKISALTPIMAELSFIMEDLALNMKNMDWRDEKVAQLRDIVKSTFSVFRNLGNGILFLTENFREVIAIVALFKIGMVALNAVMMANPISWMAVGISAAVVGVGYLIDKFVGLGEVMRVAGDIWESMTSWFSDDDGTKELAKAAQEQKRRSSELAITHTQGSQPQSGYGAYQTNTVNTYNQYQPLKPQTMKSKSEISLTIKSDKPVAVNEAKSDKATDINMDVGNMAWGF
ncbi:hypothetical protein VSAK1_13806 [Vibrio mediterranei AK1]|uniref:hypothetical protein n=1 Tax=Vibrio mediterranei TaxID=689 RepID=UPI00015426BD|nr:hypothetical protein [Vibrio mediterranei]EDL52626.1 hypothetical protein VSAK1_13806 [Vibrio mediterranei AK1]